MTLFGPTFKARFRSTPNTTIIITTITATTFLGCDEIEINLVDIVIAE